MKRKLCVMALLCLNFRAQAQRADSNIKNLGIGDTVPRTILNMPLQVVNHPQRKSIITLNEFNGKLLILDFWATNCGSCIRAIPKLDSLQTMFKDQLQILPISYEKEVIVRAFLKRNPIGQSMRLPVATNDTLLKKVFPHQILSHEVWIDEQGIVRAITDPEYVNMANVQAMLEHRSIDLPVKSDIPAFDYSRPLFNDFAKSSHYYSAIGPYRAGVVPKFGVLVDSIRQMSRIYVINFPILQMYLLSIGRLLDFPKTMIYINVKDTTRIYNPPGVYHNQWRSKNAWCYESVLPAGLSANHRTDAMRQDLNKYFNLNGRLETKTGKCLVLKRTGRDEGLIATKGGTPLNTLHSKDSVKVLRNASLSNLLWELNNIPNGLPAIDHTGIESNVDMQLIFNDIQNIGAVNHSLLKYGLVLKEETQAIEYFVLTDAQ